MAAGIAMKTDEQIDERLGDPRLKHTSPALGDARSGMSDRRLWLEEPCPTCGAPSGLRCQTSRYRGKPMRVLHAARGWRQNRQDQWRARLEIAGDAKDVLDPSLVQPPKQELADRYARRSRFVAHGWVSPSSVVCV
jgi:hypothetical protein